MKKARSSPPPPGPDPPGPQRVGPYRIEARLGSGGMGEVFRAFDTRLERRVALKRLRGARAAEPGAAGALLGEARAAAGLAHPAVVQVHDLLEGEEGCWIVLELIEGESLARLLERGPLEPGRALELAVEIGGALAAAHGRGILHRDLKAENVMLTAAGHAKVLDFGLAGLVGGSGRPGAGTPRAMAPEQARGEAAGERADLFSLGVLLYEMLAGRSPFLGPSPAATLARLLEEEPESLAEAAPEVAPELSVLTERLLAKEPGRRPESATAVLAELERIRGLWRGREVPETEGEGAPSPEAGSARLEDSSESASEGPFAFRGERRWLALLCCDLVGEGEDSASLDPERLFGVLPEFQRGADLSIRRHGGHLEHVQGHRLVACFGYPTARADSPSRAARAALEIAGSASEALAAAGMAVRVVLHAGPARIPGRSPSSSAERRLALGSTLDLALALLAESRGGAVTLGAEVRQCLGDAFRVEGEPALLLEESKEVPAPGPWVGRERGLGLLLDRWRRARESGSAVLLCGAAGVGKSRLLEELSLRLQGEPGQVLRARGRAHLRSEPLAAVAEWFEGLEGVSRGRLAGGARGDGERAALERGSRTELRAVRGEELAELLLDAAPRPLALLFDDLDLADLASLELVGRLIEASAGEALLVVATCRPELEPPWPHPLTRLRLEPLGGETAAALLASLDTGDVLGEEVRREIRDRARGLPLHLVELGREALRARERNLAPTSLPVRLEAPLAAELEGLGEGRDLLRALAVLDRAAAPEALASILGEEPEGVRQAAASLAATGALEEVEDEEGRRLRIRSPLLREAARTTVLAEDRRRLRLRAAAFAGEAAAPD